MIKSNFSNSRRNFIVGGIGTIAGATIFHSKILANEQAIGKNNLETNAPEDIVEANVELAKLWWPEQRNVWTPIGWKNHYFRFNVLYNGDVIADPNGSWLAPRKNAIPYVGKDFLLSIRPEKDGQGRRIPKERTSIWKEDGGVGIQGWNDSKTPVLYTDYPLQEGLVIRKEIFAHVEHDKRNPSSIDPLFAWVRISVIAIDEHRYPDQYPIVVQLSKNYYDHYDHFQHAVAVDINPDLASYPGALHEATEIKNNQKYLYIKESDHNIRLVLKADESQNLSFTEIQKGIYTIRLDIHAKVGPCFDILLPMLPVDSMVINHELDLGFDGSLKQCDLYWSKVPETTSMISVPETNINNIINQSLKFTEIIAEKDYVTGEYSLLSGSWGYDNLWTTPTSMVSHMFLSMMGYHEVVARYLELFRKNQGTVKPPGPAYDLHPGYYSTPKNLTAIDWLSDHGAVLHQVCTHALYSNDSIFVQEWIDSILKACDFIKDMSSKTGHNGVIGLLPPAVATDEEIPMQALWNLVWNYKGLTTAVVLLKKISHPRYAEFSKFADQFKSLFNETYNLLAKNGQYWTDKDGKKRFKPPTIMSNEQPPFHIFSDAFYLDTGPLALVWAGLMDADNPIMVDVLEFFRNGPNKKFATPIPHALMRPFLIHEMSTCEPCYSWNAFHSWQSNDRGKYLEAMYSLYIGALSQNTYISCEHRHGIQGNLFATPLAFYLTRLAVIDDQISTDELHLLRICPLAWLDTEEETIFRNMPTLFGSLNVHFSISNDKETLLLKFDSIFHTLPKKIFVHVPPLPTLKSIIVNGKKYKNLSVIQVV